MTIGESSRIISASISLPLKMEDTSYKVPEPRGRASSRDSSARWERMDGAVVCKCRSPGSRSRRRSAVAASPRRLSDYGRFVRMLLNGGALDGARCSRPKRSR